MATTSEVQLVISAKDNASKTLSSVGKSVQGLGSALGTVAKVGGAALLALGAGATAFGVSAVKAAIEAEKEMAKFNATLATMGKKGEEAKASILEMANATIKLGFDDEAAANSAAKFFKITGDLTMAQKAQATAMDIARAKSVDLETANKIVSLAFAGNTRALKEYGIELADGATKTQALSALNGLFAGQAQAYANTTAGALDILSVTYGNLKEDIGGVIMQNTNLGGLIKSLSEFINNHKQQIVDLVDKGINVAIAKIKEWYESIGGKQGLISGLQKTWDFIQIIGKAIGILITIITAVVKSLIWLKDKLTDVFFEIIMGIEKIKKAWNDLKELLKKPIDGIINLFTKEKGEKKKKDQFGGYVRAGQPVIVGEHRPEVFVPSQGGSIKQLDQAGGAINVNFNNVNVRNDGDLATIVEVVKRTLARENLYARQGINI